MDAMDVLGDGLPNRLFGTVTGEAGVADGVPFRLNVPRLKSAPAGMVVCGGGVVPK
jgi:hypothetical protein